MSTVVAGSLAAYANCALRPQTGADVVVVTTASAFRGAAQAALEVASALEESGATFEALMALDRASSDDVYFAARIARADLVVVTDGSPLHAKSVWRASAVGDALGAATLVAIGSIATVLGDVMIDPRGGAPTVGLGYRHGVVLTTPAPAEQVARTRALLNGDDPLVIVGPRGVLVEESGRWRVIEGRDDVVATRATGPVSLE